MNNKILLLTIFLIDIVLFPVIFLLLLIRYSVSDVLRKAKTGKEIFKTKWKAAKWL